MVEMMSREEILPPQNGFHVLLDVVLPLLNASSIALMGALLWRFGQPMLGGLMVLCVLGPYMAVAYIQTARCWASQQAGPSPAQIPRIQNGVWGVPDFLVSNMSMDAAHVHNLDMNRQENLGHGNLLTTLKLVICTLWGLPVIVPHLLIHDALAVTTIVLSIVKPAENRAASKSLGGNSQMHEFQLPNSSNGRQNRAKGAQGWLFKRRILELFFQSLPHVTLQLATLLVLEAHHLVWGTWPTGLWFLSTFWCLCALIANVVLVIGFACATGMGLGEILWFATENPGVVARLSDTIVFLYRDQCSVLEIDINDAEFQEIWSALVKLLQMDLENLDIIYVTAKRGNGQQNLRAGLKSLFHVIQSKERSSVKEIQVDLSVLGGFVQV